MSALRFTEDHEWVRAEDDGSVTIGITEYAQENLGDIVYVELPEVGVSLDSGEPAVVIESVKAAADIQMPIAGTVAAINEMLEDAPETVNQDPLHAGWFIRVVPASDDPLSGLLTPEAYASLIGE